MSNFVKSKIEELRADYTQIKVEPFSHSIALSFSKMKIRCSAKLTLSIKHSLTQHELVLYRGKTLAIFTAQNLSLTLLTFRSLEMHRHLMFSPTKHSPKDFPPRYYLRMSRLIFSLAVVESLNGSLPSSLKVESCPFPLG
jgi:hypothetical protein